MRYTVGHVSRLTGIRPDSLRAWERRYGVVVPDRTASGYRVYDEEDVARLRRMADLVASGARPSLAAEQVRSGDLGSPRPDMSFPAVDALVEAARRLDRAALDTALDSGFAAAPFEDVFDQWLAPSLTRLGEAWASEDVDVSGEHFVTTAVHRRLSTAFEGAGSGAGALVVVGLPPGARHEFAALGFAACLRRKGVDVRYLGSDLPVDSWATAVERLEPSAVVVPVPMPTDAPAARAVIDRVARTSPSRPVHVGGPGCAGWRPGGAAVVERATVTRAAATLAGTVGR